MENVFDAGKVPYEAAPPLMPMSIGEQIVFIVEVIFDVCKVLLMSLPYWIESLVYLFVRRPKKSIMNQVALVSFDPKNKLCDKKTNLLAVFDATNR